MRLSTVLVAVAALGTVAAVTVPPWHHPVAGTDVNYRGESNVQFAPTVAAYIKLNSDPPPSFDAAHYGADPATLNDPRPAAEVYPDIHVPDGTTAGEFMKLQVALTNWVSPQQGCAFCHAGTPGNYNFQSEAKPQKQAARIMTDMTRSLNADWSNHNGAAGVTCYSCHRGQNVPAIAWYPHPSPQPKPFVGRQEDWNYAATTVRDFFPDNGFSEYVLQHTEAHITADTALTTPKGPGSWDEFTRQYEYMMQMSDGIGVNCGFCHNSRNFASWQESTPMRWTGLSGLAMTRAINNNVMLPLARVIPQTAEIPGEWREPIVPADETGPQNGNSLVICASCHYGNPRPLNGVNMVHDYPLLIGSPNPAATAANEAASFNVNPADPDSKVISP